MPKQRGCWVALAAALVVTGPGCGGPVKVQGRVSLDGVPVERATVVFDREDGTGRQASGMTDSDGVFHLTSFKPGDGALPGDYKVTILPPVNVPEVKIQPGMTMAEGLEAVAKGREAVRDKPPPYGADMPAAVRDPAKTPLRQKVPPDGPVVFDLKSEEGKANKPTPPRPRKPDHSFSVPKGK